MLFLPSHRLPGPPIQLSSLQQLRLPRVQAGVLRPTLLLSIYHLTFTLALHCAPTVLSSSWWRARLQSLRST